MPRDLLNHIQYRTTESRDRDLAAHYPGRTCTDVPGEYELPGGGLLAVYLLEAWEYGPELADPEAALIAELAALDDAHAELERQAAAAAQLPPGELEPEDPEQLLRRAALNHRGEP
jgi:hypothetical protein